VFQNQFSQFSQPEICSRPVDDLVLQMKALGIERVAHFPFPTPPSPEALQAAEMILEGLGALSSDGRLTDLGRTMSRFPVSPRYGKMLAVGHQYNCLPHIISLVAALSVKELVVQTDHSWRKGEEEGRGEGGVRWSGLAALRRLCAGKEEFRLLGDLGLLLTVVGAWSHSRGRTEFSAKTGLQPRAMREVTRLRQQLTNSVNMICPDLNLVIDPSLAPPTEAQARHLRQIVLAGLGDHVARKISTDNMSAEDKRKLRFSYQVTGPCSREG
jgi:ATP-dependent RNA helicase DHX37/DHR1